MGKLIIKEQVTATIPSKFGQFKLSLFTTNKDDKEHLVLTFGDVKQAENVLIRIHSECVTGDILGSLRCDCGEQLQISMGQIANEGCGMIIYLRQEGRGIGLAEKLRSYNLQDQGKDTVDANLALGYKEDERSYEIAAQIIHELQIKSIRLLTNNPTKINELHRYGVQVTARVPIKGPIHSHNAFYLLTKNKKMQHYFEEEDLQELQNTCKPIKNHKPAVTLAYAQSLDGSISLQRRERLLLSSPESLVMTHKLRSQHDAILVGVGTILNDDPLLTVRHYKGKNPRVIIFDSKLRISTQARVLQSQVPPIIFTTPAAEKSKLKMLLENNVTVIVTEPTRDGRIDISTALKELYKLGINSVMVEGGRGILTSFINEKQADKVIITVAPMFVGGVSVIAEEMNQLIGFPKLSNIQQYKLGTDIIIMGDMKGRQP